MALDLRGFAAVARVSEVPRGRFDSLQGLRGLAVLLVVLSHSLVRSGETDALGGMGVTIFFTLSGFLITGVLLTDRWDTVHHALAFYGARAVRLLPALLALVLVTGVIWLVSDRAPSRFIEYASTAVFYVEDFFAVQHDQQILAHTWSLAVEEQFYLLWPFVLLVLLRLRRSHQALLLCSLILVSLIARYEVVHLGETGVAYTSFFTNAYALLIGCLTRMVPLRLLRGPWAAWVGLIGIATLILVADGMPQELVTVPACTAILTSLVILGSLDGNRLLAWRPFTFLGAVSYAWYLWHWPLLWLTNTLHTLPVSLLVCVAALVVATMSTFLLEQPLRARYQRATRRPSRLTSSASTLGSTAQVVS